MQKILLNRDIDQVLDRLVPQVAAYIREQQTRTFEGFGDFDLLGFDWYDVEHDVIDTSRVLIYLDREDLFLFCEDPWAYDRLHGLLPEGLDNEKALYRFFVELLRSDMDLLEDYETEITETEDAALRSSRRDYLDKIAEYRRELLRRKRYYEQLDAIFDDLTANDNGLLSEDAVRHFAILGNRTERFRSSVLNLRDYVTQMREAYQAQIDIEQNNLMRVFTVITAVFLPLSLLAGWYGMNFSNMPELQWKYGYPVFIVVSVAICVGLVVWFKKKKWF